MSARRGFTLVEVMIALLISSVVVLLAYSTLRAGLDTEQRVTEARDSDERATTFRALLSDALRHAVTSDSGAVTSLIAERNSEGRTSRLAFSSRGVTPPLGGSGVWSVDLSAGESGIEFTATPSRAVGAPLRMLARGIPSFEVRFLSQTDPSWRDDWPDPTRLPVAVEVRFLDASGRELMAPLVSRLASVSGS